MKLCGRRIS